MFARVVGRVIAVPALQRIAPVWLVLGLGAVVISGPNGMSARDVVLAGQTSGAIAVALAAAWLIAATPAVHAALAEGAAGGGAGGGPGAGAGLRWLRALPVPRWWWWCARAAALGIVQLPVLMIGGRGAGWGWGALAAAAAAGAGTLLVVAGRSAGLWWRSRRRAAAPAAAVAASGAAARRATRPVPGLMMAHLRAIARTRSAAVGRAAIVALIGGGFAGLLVRPLAAEAGLAATDAAAGFAATGAAIGLAVAAVVLAAAVGGLAAPVVESEHAMAWMLECSGTGFAAAGLAAVLVVSGLGALLGLGFAAIFVWIGAAPAAIAIRWIGEGGAAGASLAALALAAARSSLRGAIVDGGRVVWRMTLVAVAALVVIGLLGEPALLLLVAAGGTAAARTAARPREAFVR